MSYLNFFTLLVFGTWYFSVSLAQSPVIKAINPTEAGQIGVNPVSVPAEAPSELIANIGKNTKYLTNLGGSATSWIGQDPSYVITLTTSEITTGTAATPSSSVLSNVALKVDIEEDGTLNILTAPALSEKLEALAKDIPPCPAATKLRRRQSGACGFAEFMNRVSTSEAINLDEITEAMPAGRQLIPANDLIRLMTMFRAAATAYAVGAVATVVVPPMAVSYLWHAWNAMGNNGEDGGHVADPNAGKLPPVIKVSADMQGDRSTLGEPVTKKKCPPTPYLCQDNDCQGFGTKQRCKENNHKKWCDCMFPATLDTDTMSLNWYLAVQDDLLNADKIPDEGTTTCSKDLLNVETGLWLELADKFCATSDINVNVSKVLTTADAASNGNRWANYGGWDFTFSWADLPGFCDLPCNEIFHKFTEDTACSFNSHTVARNGTIDYDCGVGSFSIKNSTTACMTQIPTPADGWIWAIPSTSFTAPPPQSTQDCHKQQPGNFIISSADSFIAAFCYQAELKQWHWTEQTPNTPDANNLLSAGSAYHIWKEPRISGSKPGRLQQVTINMTADHQYCPDYSKPVDVKFGPAPAITAQDCIDHFRMAVDQCESCSLPGSSMGGSVYAQCMKWDVSMQYV